MSEEKKPTPSTNIPLLSYRKSEQLWQISFLEPVWNNFQIGLNLPLRVNRAKYIAC